jgi:Icc protein
LRPLQAPAAGEPLRILHLSDPHLLSDPSGRCRGFPPLARLSHGLEQAFSAAGGGPDLLLITGDLADDESWGAYRSLRDLTSPLDCALALVPGNHDHALLLHAVLGRQAVMAPGSLRLGHWTLILLSTHCPGRLDGRLDPRQLEWLRMELGAGEGPVLVALHHPPVPIGDPGFDAIGLRQPEPLLALLAASPRVQAVAFGHVHQHWLGSLPGRPEVPLLACPSTLCSFAAVQPCPLGRADDPGGRWLELGPGARFREELLRWSPPA